MILISVILYANIQIFSNIKRKAKKIKVIRSKDFL